MNRLVELTKDTRVLVVYLSLLQVCDLLFTHWGCTTIGIHAEGNPLMIFMMEKFGILSGLLIAKSVAFFFILALFKTGAINILRFLSAIYTIVIGMWIYAYFLWS